PVGGTSTSLSGRRVRIPARTSNSCAFEAIKISLASTVKENIVRKPACLRVLHKVLKASTQSSATCYHKVAACEANTGNANRAVCGTDGRTYPSKCHLMKAQCTGETVTIAHRGPCVVLIVI
ncbi:jg27233, partial [Pararge aegeria aegeria]